MILGAPLCAALACLDPLAVPIDSDPGLTGGASATGDSLTTGATATSETPTTGATATEEEPTTGAPACVPPSGAADGVAYLRQATGPGRQTIQAVVRDGTGDTYLAGNFSGELALGGPPRAIDGGVAPFVARLDCTGEPVWIRVGAPQASAEGYARALAVHGQDIYIAGALLGSVEFDDGSALIGGDGSKAFVARLDAATGDVLRSVVIPEQAIAIDDLVVVDDVDIGHKILAAGGCQQGELFGVLIAELTPDLVENYHCTYSPMPPGNPARPSKAVALALHSPELLIVGGQLSGPLPGHDLVIAGGTDGFVAGLPLPLKFAPEDPFTGAWVRKLGAEVPQDRVNDVAVSDSGTIVAVGLGRGQFSLAGSGCEAESGIVTGFITQFDKDGLCVAHEMLATDVDQSTEAHAVTVRGETIYVLGQSYGSLGVGGVMIPEAVNMDGIRMFMLALSPAMTLEAQHFSEQAPRSDACSYDEMGGVAEKARVLGRGIAADDDLVVMVADACGGGIRVGGADIANTDAFVLGLSPVK